MTDVVVCVQFRVHDEPALRKFVEEHCSPAFKEQPLSTVLFSSLVDLGQLNGKDIELLSHCVLPVLEPLAVSRGKGLPYSLTLIVRVNEEERLREAAKDSYESNWFDSEWTPDSYGEAVYELLIASNSRPAPLDLGFEIENTHYPLDHPYAPEVPEVDEDQE